MCLKTKTVSLASRSHYYHQGFGNPCYVTVPCGSCPECVDMFRNDFFIRFKAEYDDCISKGGTVVFLTWTYSDTNVPAYTYRIDNNDIVFDKVLVNSKSSDSTPYIFAFDKYHVQKFFNSFRKKFERLGIHSPMRYAVVGEYGTDTKYTQRPHFHGLIFLSKEVTNYYIKRGNGNFDESDFLEDSDIYWQHGIVSASEEHGLLVNNDDAIRYVSKYISKNILLSNLKRFKAFRKFIKDNIDYLDPVDFNYNKSVDSLFLYYLRKVGSSLFVMKSRGLGLTAIKPLQRYLLNYQYDEFYKQFKKGFSYLKDGKTKYIPYSFYYYRKLFYSVRDDGSYFLNVNGFHYLSLAMHDKFLSRYLAICDLNFHNLDNSDDITFCLSIVKDTRSLFNFCIYDCFVRGRSYPFAVANNVRRILNSDGIFGSFTPKELVYYFVRANYGYCFDDDIRNSFSRHDSSLSDVIYNGNGLSYSEPYFDSKFELFRTCVDKLISDSRYEKRKEQDLLFEMTKVFKDLSNSYIYNLF